MNDLRIQGALATPSSSTDTLSRVHKLKNKFLQKQNAIDGEEAITYILSLLEEDTPNKILQRACYSTVLVILSNVQNKSLSSACINRVHKLFAGKTTYHKQDEDILSSLKTFQLAIIKSNQKPDKNDLQSIVANLREACFEAVDGTASSATQRLSAAPRERVQISTSGSMGNFSLSHPISSSTRRPPRRKSSTSSFSNGGSVRSLGASESDTSDGTRATRGVRDSATIRLEGLRSLAALAKLDTRALHPFWPSFFGPTAKPSLLHLAKTDLSLAVRLQAIQTIRVMLKNSKGYLALARESNTKSAFTPISQTIADIANDLNVKTAQLVEACFVLPQAKDLLVQSIQLAGDVVENTSYDRLSANHLASLLAILLAHVVRPNDSAALEAVADVLRRIQAASPASQHFPDTFRTASTEIFGKIKAAKEDDPCLLAYWSLLSSLMLLQSNSQTTTDVSASIVQHVNEVFICSNHKLQERQLDTLLVALKHVDIEIVRACLREMLAAARDIDSPFVQAKIVQLALANLSALSGRDDLLKLVTLAIALASEKGKDIRIQAYRALGSLLQSQRGGDARALYDSCFSCLAGACQSDISLAARGEALWNMANVLDALPASCGDAVRFAMPDLLANAIPQTSLEGASRDAEQVRTNSIRVVGTLLSQVDSTDDATKQKGRDCLIAALSRASPKTQWNAASAIAKVITAGLGNDRMIDALVTTLQASDNVKVQACVISALEKCDTGLLISYKEDLARIAKQAEEHRHNLPFNEMTRSTAMQQSLESLLARLRPAD